MSIKSGVLVHDVLEAYVLDDVNSTAHYFGCLTESSINKTVNSEDIRCGIGNVLKAVYDTDQDITFAVTTAMHSDHFIEYQTGGTFSTGSFDLWKHEVKTAVDNTGSIEVTITGTPKGDVVKVIDKYNKEYVATHTTGTVVITGGVEGATYTVFYEEVTAGADILEFNASDYATNLHVMLHGIAFDPATNAIVSDIYYDFPISKPDGNLDLAYALATNITPSISFRAISDATGKMGNYIVVDR